jgi:hypothetical protein
LKYAKPNGTAKAITGMDGMRGEHFFSVKAFPPIEVIPFRWVVQLHTTTKPIGIVLLQGSHFHLFHFCQPFFHFEGCVTVSPYSK